MDRLARAGARITRALAPCVPEAMALAPTLFAPEAYGIWQDQIEDAPELAIHDPGTLSRRCDDAGRRLRRQHKESLNRLPRRLGAAGLGFDAVILPTVPILHDARLATEPDFFTAENLLALRNTRIANLLWPAGDQPADRTARLRHHADGPGGLTGGFDPSPPPPRLPCGPDPWDLAQLLRVNAGRGSRFSRETLDASGLCR